jgi:hypothetical protein
MSPRSSGPLRAARGRLRVQCAGLATGRAPRAPTRAAPDIEGVTTTSSTRGQMSLAGSVDRGRQDVWRSGRDPRAARRAAMGGRPAEAFANLHPMIAGAPATRARGLREQGGGRRLHAAPARGDGPLRRTAGSLEDVRRTPRRQCCPRSSWPRWRPSCAEGSFRTAWSWPNVGIAAGDALWRFHVGVEVSVRAASGAA